MLPCHPPPFFLSSLLPAAAGPQVLQDCPRQPVPAEASARGAAPRPGARHADAAGPCEWGRGGALLQPLLLLLWRLLLGRAAVCAAHVSLSDAPAIEELSPRLPCHPFTPFPPKALPRPAPPFLLLQAARQEVQDKDILASQQEYRKGVSSWNFDVAALKAAAAAAREEEDEQRLPPISEYSGGWGGRAAGQAGREVYRLVGVDGRMLGGRACCAGGRTRLPSLAEGNHLAVWQLAILWLPLGSQDPVAPPCPALPCPPAEVSELMKEPSNAAAVAAAAAEFPGSRPLTIETVTSAGSSGSPLAAGKSPMGPGSRTVRWVAGWPGDRKGCCVWCCISLLPGWVAEVLSSLWMQLPREPRSWLAC